MAPILFDDEETAVVSHTAVEARWYLILFIAI